MKLFGAALLFIISTMAEGAQATSNRVAADIPVHVEVNCRGLDMEKLDSVSANIVGQVLEESYHNTKSMKGSWLKINWRCGRLCPDDDNLVTENNDENGFGWEGSLSYENGNRLGNWRCGRLCPDDDNLAKSGGDSLSDFLSEEVTQWENRFLMELVHTRRGVYRTVEECNISVRAASSMET